MSPRASVVLTLTCLVLWLASVYGAYRHGVRTRDAECVAAEVKPLTAIIEEKAGRDAVGNKALAQAAKAVARVEGTYNVLKLETARYVETRPDLSGCSLDPGGMRLWRAANSGDFPEPSAGASDAAMPGPAAAAIPGPGTPAFQPCGGDGDPSPCLRGAERPAIVDSFAGGEQ